MPQLPEGPADFLSAMVKGHFESAREEKLRYEMLSKHFIANQARVVLRVSIGHPQRLAGLLSM